MARGGGKMKDLLGWEKEIYIYTAIYLAAILIIKFQFPTQVFSFYSRAVVVENPIKYGLIMGLTHAVIGFLILFVLKWKETITVGLLDKRDYLDMTAITAFLPIFFYDVRLRSIARDPDFLSIVCFLGIMTATTAALWWIGQKKIMWEIEDLPQQ